MALFIFLLFDLFDLFYLILFNFVIDLKMQYFLQYIHQTE